MYKLLNSSLVKQLSFLFFVLSPCCSNAQQAASDTSNIKKTTSVSGIVTDAISGRPLSLINIIFNGSHYGTTTDKEGRFSLNARGLFSRVTFTYTGYQLVSKTIKPGQTNELQIYLHTSQTQLKEVSISAGKSKKYRNKGNPAVELIQQVIDHKAQNNMESSDYLQYDQYERIGLSLFNLSPKLINGPIFSPYKFMIDTALKIDGKTQVSLPVFF